MRWRRVPPPLLVLALAAAVASGLPAARPAAARDAPALALTLVGSATKAEVGEIVAFTAWVENTGAATIPDISVRLGLPGGLHERAVDCRGETNSTVTNCALGAFAPGAVAAVRFVVEVGVTEPAIDGEVTESVSSPGADGVRRVLARAQLPPLKIVGPGRHPR